MYNKIYSLLLCITLACPILSMEVKRAKISSDQNNLQSYGKVGTLKSLAALALRNTNQLQNEAPEEVVGFVECVKKIVSKNFKENIRDFLLEYLETHSYEQSKKIIDVFSELKISGFDYSQGAKDSLLSLLQSESINFQEHQGLFNHLLLRGAERNHISVVCFALDSGADVHANNDKALRVASKMGYIDIVTRLIEKGADVCAKGGKALYSAVRYGHVSIVRLLLDNNAGDVAQSDIYGIAIGCNEGLEIAELLVADEIPLGNFAKKVIKLFCRNLSKEMALIPECMGDDILLFYKNLNWLLSSRFFEFNAKNFKEIFLLVECGADPKLLEEYVTPESESEFIGWTHWGRVPNGHEIYKKFRQLIVKFLTSPFVRMYLKNKLDKKMGLFDIFRQPKIMPYLANPKKYIMDNISDIEQKAQNYVGKEKVTIDQTLVANFAKQSPILLYLVALAQAEFSLSIMRGQPISEQQMLNIAYDLVEAGQTELIWAAIFSHKEIVEILLSHNLPIEYINSRDAYGNTALDYAQKNNNCATAQIISDKIKELENKQS